MTVKLRYKGRSFGSAQSLGAALKRDIAQTVDRALRSAASASGAHIRKTGQGYESRAHRTSSPASTGASASAGF